MRIFIPTSNQYVGVCSMTCKLLKKYWPNHPPVDVGHFENKPDIDNLGAGFWPIYFGRQTSFSWAEQMLAYAQGGVEELVLLCLDDYGLFKPVNEAVICAGIDVMADCQKWCSIALTWQPCDVFDRIGDWVLFHQWAWSFNTQAAIWRRTDLLRILESIPPKTGVWRTEQAGTRFFHRTMWPEGKRMAGWYIPRPDNASGFVDETDKTNWPMQYNNLYRQGRLDKRHIPFLQSEGLL